MPDDERHLYWRDVDRLGLPDGDGFPPECAMEVVQAVQMFQTTTSISSWGHTFSSNRYVFYRMALIDIFPPSWAAGELALRCQGESTERCRQCIKGAAMAPTPVLYAPAMTRSGTCGATVAIWPSITTAGTSCNDPDPGQRPDGVQQRHRLCPSGHTETFNLDAVTDPPAEWRFLRRRGALHAVSAHEVTDVIRETAAAAGGYRIANGVLVGIAAATFLTRLQALSAARTALAGLARTPSATRLRATDSTTFTLRRKQQYLYVTMWRRAAARADPHPGQRDDGIERLNPERGDEDDRPGGGSRWAVVGGHTALEIRRDGGTPLLQHFVEGRRRRQTTRRRGRRATRSRRAASRR